MNRIALLLLLLPLALAGGSLAEDLDLVEVSHAEFNCMFTTSEPCTISTGPGQVARFTITGTSGEGLLSSDKIQDGEPGTPMENLHAYRYRVDLSGMAAIGAPPCVRQVTFDFGPNVKLDLNGDGVNEDAFVSVGGAIGTISPSRIVRNLDTVSFIYSPPVCAGESSRFAGLVSEAGPGDVPAELTIPPDGTRDLTVTAPVGFAPTPPPTPERPCEVQRFGWPPSTEPLPFPNWVPLCRCLQDPGLRSLGCRFVHPDLIGFRRVPWPIAAGESFEIAWEITPTRELAAPVVITEELPAGFGPGQAQTVRLELAADAVGQTVTASAQAIAGNAAGESSGLARIEIRGAEADLLGIEFDYRVETAPPVPEPDRAPGGRGVYWLLILLALAVLVWLLRRSRGG